jgi:tetratricopeptide (TPR) repeat protein
MSSPRGAMASAGSMRGQRKQGRIMPRHHKPARDRDERREDALRPSSYLGYDRDTLGLYFFEREAFALAEAQFRRAAWLNPYEPMFKVHLALALLRLERLDDAKAILAEVLRTTPDPVARQVWQSHWPDTCPPAGEQQTDSNVVDRTEPAGEADAP